ncbi:hypothetical protein [Nonomuraea rubra]|uniref:MFS transporter n=1 Tax=Nonomuraea rubra TaxID=46180 RepID=A0A7X0P1Q8_9ACTN|nr:hypothetical protein [Nonomuraea rubra]MBB6553416.1 hypothetical protein [Nonomuraea rubra]
MPPSLAGPITAGVIVDTVGRRWVFLSVPALITVAAPALLRGLAGHPVSSGRSSPLQACTARPVGPR